MIWFAVHTADEKPVLRYQRYPTPEQAERMRVHLGPIVHRPLVVEPVEVPDRDWAPEVSR